MRRAGIRHVKAGTPDESPEPIARRWISELKRLRGKEVSCKYDLATDSVLFEFGRFYEDEIEAEFFGDHIEEGQPCGYRFAAITDYSSSNENDLQLGQLEVFEVKAGICNLAISGEVSDLAGRVTFSFRAIEQILSQRRPSKT